VKILFISIFLVFFAYAQTLPLPIKYDPFQKAKKLMKDKSKVVKNMKRFDLKLYAIYNNRAYINGKFYKIGDKVAGFKVIKISNKYVVLKKNRKKVVLPLVKSNIIKTVERQ